MCVMASEEARTLQRVESTSHTFLTAFADNGIKGQGPCPEVKLATGIVSLASRGCSLPPSAPRSGGGHRDPEKLRTQA